MTDKKKVFFMADVSTVITPRYKYEFAVKNVWPLVKGDVGVEDYLPVEELNAGRFHDRHFFWNILNTLRPLWVVDYFRKSADARYAKRRQWNKDKCEINISPQWQELLG